MGSVSVVVCCRAANYCFYSEFNVKLGEGTLGFFKSKKVVQKLNKLNSSLKTFIYDILCLRLKKKYMRIERNWKNGPFKTFQFIFDQKVEIVLIRSIFSITFSFLSSQHMPSLLLIFKKRCVVSLYWFAMQQQTSTQTRPKCASFYSDFNAILEELTLGFCKSKELFQNMKKLISSLKTQIYNIRSQRLKKEDKIMKRNWKDGPFITFQFVFDLKAEIILIRSIFKSRFGFMNPQSTQSC